MEGEGVPQPQQGLKAYRRIGFKIYRPMYRIKYLNKRIKRLKRLKGKQAEPKRAQTGYKIFRKEFIARMKRQEYLRRLRQASRAWDAMGRVERAPYYEKAQRKALYKNGNP